VPSKTRQVKVDDPGRGDLPKPQPKVIIHGIMKIKVERSGFLEEILPEKNGRL
jgi:hypothetical protein